MEGRWHVGERLGDTELGARWKSLRKLTHEFFMGDEESNDQEGEVMKLWSFALVYCAYNYIDIENENTWKLEVIRPMRKGSSDATALEESYVPDLREVLLDD